MCGLVGVAGNLIYDDEMIMRKLLVYDYFRGPDSTGIATIPIKPDEGPTVVKTASHPFDLMDMVRFKKALSSYTCQAFIGHNRAATLGKVNSANAHPFHESHIIGAHNGTLSAGCFTELKRELGYQYDVDSQAIFAAIAKYGIEATIPMLQGAWALTWYDLEKKTLNFIRNKERPLWYAFSKDMKRMFWASEYDMIALATEGERNSCELYVDVEGYRFYSFRPDTLHTFDLDDFYNPNIMEPVSPVTKTLKGRPPAVTVTYTGNYTTGAKPTGGGPAEDAPFHGGTKTTSLMTTSIGRGTTSQNTYSTRALTVVSDGPIIDVYGSPESPYGDVITRTTFNAITVNGCNYCGADIKYGDTGLTVFIDDERVLCGSCSGNDPFVNRFYTSDVEAKINTALTA